VAIWVEPVDLFSRQQLEVERASTSAIEQEPAEHSQEKHRLKSGGDLYDKLRYDETADIPAMIEATLETATAMVAIETILKAQGHEVGNEQAKLLQVLETEGDLEGPDVTQASEIGGDDERLASFDTETVETYLQLAAIIDPHDVKVQPPFVTFSEVTTTYADSQEALLENKPTAMPDFEAFRAAQPITEKPVTSEIVQEQIAEQPLEKTLVLLAEHVARTAEAPEQTVLSKAIEEAWLALPTHYNAEEMEEVGLHITPELTGKLLAFLRTLGYRHPQETLVSFVDKYGVVFLVQALAHIYQLSNDDGTHEFLTTSATTSPPADDDTPQLRLGNLLLGFIGKLSLGPEPI
jgi:hypothetical protein